MNKNELVDRMLENIFYDQTSIEEAKQSLEDYKHKSDGTELLSLDDAHVMELADSYAEEYGIDAFINILAKVETPSDAIYEAATQKYIQEAYSEVRRVLDEVAEKFEQAQASPGFGIKRKTFRAGDSSSLDYFSPKRSLGNVEIYRNIEGSNHYDLHRLSIEHLGGQFSYLIEIEVEPR